LFPGIDFSENGDRLTDEQQERYGRLIDQVIAFASGDFEKAMKTDPEYWEHLIQRYGNPMQEIPPSDERRMVNPRALRDIQKALGR